MTFEKKEGLNGLPKQTCKITVNNTEEDSPEACKKDKDVEYITDEQAKSMVMESKDVSTILKDEDNQVFIENDK